MRSLDCTLRDGGYYTNWDFQESFLNDYLNTVNKTDIEYIEIGYRSIPLEVYKGEYYYLPISRIKYISEKTKIKIAIMLDVKNLTTEDLSTLLIECRDYVSLIRIAATPETYQTLDKYITKIREYGFEVALNLMYLSTWIKDKDFIINAIKWSKNYKIDYLYFVDSYGSVLPQQIIDISDITKNIETITLGFHGHDNLSMALANSIEAINSGFKIIDSTFQGMGRGAGNLKTELFLQYYKYSQNIELDNDKHFHKFYNRISEMKKHYEWGTDISYITAGFVGFPQGKIMDFISLRSSNTENIEKVILNKSHKIERKKATTNNVFETIVIIGGGKSSVEYTNQINEFLKKHTYKVIFTSSKHMDLFIDNIKFPSLILSGDEYIRVSNTINNIDDVELVYNANDDFTLLPVNHNNIQELDEEYILKKSNSRTEFGLAYASKLGASQILLLGYDGYDKFNKKESELSIENQSLFNIYDRNIKIFSLLPTKYSIEKKSLFSLL